MTKENLLKMFEVRSGLAILFTMTETAHSALHTLQYNPFKQRIISDKIPDGTSTTVYRCGTMIDLCRGPHIPHTGRVKSLSVLKVRRSLGRTSLSMHILKLGCPELGLVLSRRPEQRVPAAPVRYLFPRHQLDEGVQEVPRGGRQARPPSDR